MKSDTDLEDKARPVIGDCHASRIIENHSMLAQPGQLLVEVTNEQDSASNNGEPEEKRGPAANTQEFEEAGKNCEEHAQDSAANTASMQFQPGPAPSGMHSSVYQSHSAPDAGEGKAPPEVHVAKSLPKFRQGAWLLLAALILVPLSLSWNQFNFDRLNRAGTTAAHQKRLDAAEKSFLSALAESEKFGHQNRNVATSLSNLAEVYRLGGEFSKAESFQQRALKLRLHLFGENYPDVANSLVSLGLIKEKTEQPELAKQFYEKALAINTSCGKPEDTAVVLVRLANLSMESDRDLALNRLEQALQLHGSAPNPELNAEAAALLARIYREESLAPASLYKYLSILASQGGNEQAIFNLSEALPWGDRNFKRKNEYYERVFQALKKSASIASAPTSSTCNLFIKWAQVDNDSRDLREEQLIRVLQRELAWLESNNAEDDVTSGVLTSLTRCKGLPVSRRREYAERSIQACERFMHKYAKQLRRDGYSTYSMDSTIHDAYEARVRLEPSRAAETRTQEIALWEKECGSKSPKLATVLIELAAKLPPGAAERESYYKRAVPILASYIRSVSKPHVAPTRDLTLNQIYGSLAGAHQFGSSTVRREFYNLIEEIAGANHYLVGKALNVLASDSSLAQAERLGYIQRALKIWRDTTCQKAVKVGGTYSLLVDRTDMSATFDTWAEIAPDNIEAIRKERAAFYEQAFGQTDELARSLVDLGRLQTLPERERKKYLERAIAIWSTGVELDPLSVNDAFRSLAELGGGKNAEAVYLRQREWIKTRDSVRYLLPELTCTLAEATDRPKAKAYYLQQAITIGLAGQFEHQDYFSDQLDSNIAQLAEIDERLVWNVVTKFVGTITTKSISQQATFLTKIASLEGLPPGMRLALAKRATEMWGRQPHIGPLDLASATQSFTTLAQLQTNEADIRSTWARAILLCDRHASSGPQGAICANRLGWSIQQRYRESNTALPASEAQRCRSFYQYALRIWEQRELPALTNQQITEYTATLWGLAGLLSPAEAEPLYKQAVQVADTIGNRPLYVQALGKMCVCYANNNNFDKALQICTLMKNCGAESDAKNYSLVVNQLANPAKFANKNAAHQNYLNCLNSQINRNWASPYYNSASVRVTFNIGTNGSVSNIRKVESTDSEVFDQAGVACIGNAAPYLRLPERAKPLHIDYTFSH